jgi:hypothetical protein
MSLRIGFDMDGVLADFASAFHQVEIRLFGHETDLEAGQPETEEERQTRSQELTPSRRVDAVWDAIMEIPDFWAGLPPLEPGAVRRIHELALQHRWEVFFITQRPDTRGETVQRQTHRWLVAQGFDLPSVLVIRGSRGAAAGALRLDYLVDDSPQNCLDVLADSAAKPILVISPSFEAPIASARKLGIAVTQGIGESLSLLEQVMEAGNNPGLLKRIATMVGWKS